jgi:hypothetical protein
MFEKILTANRGDKSPTGGEAAMPNRAAAESRKCYFTVETVHV